MIFSLPLKTNYKMVEYEKNGVVVKFPYCDYQILRKVTNDELPFTEK